MASLSVLVVPFIALMGMPTTSLEIDPALKSVIRRSNTGADRGVRVADKNENAYVALGANGNVVVQRRAPSKGSRLQVNSTVIRERTRGVAKFFRGPGPASIAESAAESEASGNCNLFCDELADMVAPMQRSLEKHGSLRHTSYGFVCIELHSGGAETPAKGNKCLQRHAVESDHAPWGQRQWGLQKIYQGGGKGKPRKFVKEQPFGDHMQGLQRFFDAVRPKTNTTVLLMLQDDGYLPREHVTTLRKHGIPVLAFCAECDRDDIMLMPDPEFIATNGQFELAANVDRFSSASPWKNKRRVVAFRGGSTGAVPHSSTREGLAVNDRLRVALAANDPKLGNDLNAPESILDVGVERSIKKPFSWLKNGSRGPPWSPEGFWAIESKEVINAMYDLHLVKEPQTIEQMVTARGLLDIDGFTNSWSGLFWKLRSNSVVLKVQSKYCEWFYSKLQSGVHFLQIENDLGNLLDVAQTVIGNTTDEKLIKIATTATEFTKDLTFESEAQQLQERLERWQ